jgi:propionyl-CoA carboxylase alpha chain
VVPGVDVEFGVTGAAAGLRLDSGVEDGSSVGIHYDPMLAKVIAWAPARQQAVLALADALTRSHVHGLVTNRDLLVNVLRHPAFLAGETDTAFFDRHGLATLAAPLLDGPARDEATLAAALAVDAATRAEARILPRLPTAWRNVVSQPHRVEFDDATVTFRLTRDGLVADGFESTALVAATPHEVVLETAGVQRRFAVDIAGDDVYVDTASGPLVLRRASRFHDPAEQVAAGSLLAPMPGSVVRVAVETGQRVRAGEPILWLEAMKMQHRIDAPADGVIAELPVRAGQQIEVGAVLAVVEEEQ